MSRTNNLEFENKGYLFVPAMIKLDSEIVRPEPENDDIPAEYKPWFEGLNRIGVGDRQVEGSIERYKSPEFKDIYYQVKPVVEKHIGKKLLPTYFFDRVYYPGQPLKKHVDRFECEISLSMHISTNLSREDAAWPLKFLKDGEHHSVTMPNPGDAVIYKGDSVPHWRDPMPGVKDSDDYFHQVFFHWVLADGYYVEHAYDPLR